VIKFNQCADVDAEIITALDKYAVAIRPKRWDGKAKPVKAFKEAILTQGLIIQAEKCAWCTLTVGAMGRRTAHRDHIAPKARYPQWTFLPKNLVVACEYCNGFAVKGELDTIENISNVYDDCEFFLVHPYNDDPREHVEFLYEVDGTRISIKSTSLKGKWTIEKLKLDSPGSTIERAKEYLYLQRKNSLPSGESKLFQDAIKAFS